MRTRLRLMLKRLLFEWYVLIAMVLASLCVVAAVKTIMGSKECITAIALIVSFIFFIQKQKLNELTLFWELFKTFNARYDELNEKMNHIISRKGDLTEKEKDTLYDYFNLCSEEYIFYKRGHILQEVWEAWKNGMQLFYENERIKSLWDEELATNSYYGFSLKN